MRSLANKWRTLAHGLWTAKAISDDSDKHTESEFDELVIGNDTDPCWFHLEQMTERDWWFAFYPDKTMDRRVCGNMRIFHTKPNEFRVWVEDGVGNERVWEYPDWTVNNRLTIRWCKHHWLPVAGTSDRCYKARGKCDVVTLVEVTDESGSE